MKTYLIGAAALLVSAAAVAQVAPSAAPAAAKAAKVHSRAEVQAKVTEHFAKLDTNRDGSITQAEADAARQTLRAARVERVKERRGDRRENAFARLDADRNGAITRAEWDAAGAQREQRVTERDRNGDGRPDRRGFRRAGVHGLGGQMFTMADANKDGRVTLQEAQAAALQHFDTADANRDGQVTREERKQLHQRMRAQKRG